MHKTHIFDQKNNANIFFYQPTYPIFFGPLQDVCQIKSFDGCYGYKTIKPDTFAFDCFKSCVKSCHTMCAFQLQKSENGNLHYAFFRLCRYSRDYVVTGMPYSGADRHNGEIASFHLQRYVRPNTIT